MADNVAITPGTGATVAADEIGGVLHQRVKISQGADGSATDVSSAAPLQVTLANGTVPSHAVTNAGTFAVQVSSIAAGDNNIGNVDIVSLPALAAGTNNIGDVDVLSVVPGTGATALGKAADSAAGGTDTGVAILAVRDDALSTLTPAEGDYVPLRTNARGALYTEIDPSSDGIIATGTAGSPASEVLTVQGISGGTPANVETAIQYIDVTLSLHTNAGEALDLLADAQIVAACTRANDVEALLQSVVVIDEDDNKAAIRLIFLSASTSLGTEGAAIAMTDAMLREVLGVVDIATGDYFDFGGGSIVSKNNVGIVCKPATGTDDIYVAAQLTTGTPTYTASGIRLRLGFI